MPTIKNIETEAIEFGDIAAKLHKAYPFLKLDAADVRKIKELTPTHTRRIAYDLVSANTALANGWRRVMLDEIRWPRLTCQMDAIRSDDAFNMRLTDYIQNRIQLIPTGWLDEAKTKEGAMYLLEVKNTTQKTIIVKSSEIHHQSGVKIEFDTGIDLCNLMPGRMIKIPIVVEWGINRTHASFSNFHGVLYRPLTIAGKAITNELVLPPSYQVHPDGYRIGLTCEAFVDPRKSACKGWSTITEKLERAAAAITEFERRPDLPYITDQLTVTQIRGGAIRYEFLGETLTLTNIIAWYAYVADPDVSYLQPGDDHPEDPSSLIRVVHKDHARLLREAALAAAKDCKSLSSALL